MRSVLFKTVVVLYYELVRSEVYSPECTFLDGLASFSIANVEQRSRCGIYIVWQKIRARERQSAPLVEYVFYFPIVFAKSNAYFTGQQHQNRGGIVHP